MLKRTLYLNRLIRSMWNGEIKIITGLCGCGKSVLLFDLFYEYLLTRGTADDHILKIELISVAITDSEILLSCVNI